MLSYLTLFGNSMTVAEFITSFPRTGRYDRFDLQKGKKNSKWVQIYIKDWKKKLIHYELTEEETHNLISLHIESYNKSELMKSVRMDSHLISTYLKIYK